MSRYAWIPFVVLWLLYWLAIPVYAYWLTVKAPFPLVFARGLGILVVHGAVAWLHWRVLLRLAMCPIGRRKYWGRLALLVAGGVAALMLLETAVQHAQHIGTVGIFGFGVAAILMVFGLLFPLLLTTIYGVYRLYFEKEIAERGLLAAKSQAELNLLKSQVNPHFLFNTLNHIYTLIRLKSEKAGPHLLKLSDMLRYMLYECSHEQVPLARELAYLDDYLDLQKLRTAEPQDIRWELRGEAADVFVPPMLFIPFFENVVKHGNLNDTQNGWLRGHLTVNRDAQSLDFQLENSLPAPELRRSNQPGGIGLDNVRRRLAMHFPARHTLAIEQTETTFFVQMNLPLALAADAENTLISVSEERDIAREDLSFAR